ncbi:MAG: response regulator [Acidobacteria bacterium]|nr:response regulator [Acidobacteriota bacterium]
MILVALDDLLFKSKIRTAARQLGVEVAFARTLDEVMQQARRIRPSLLIVDLNSAPTDPLTAIARIKADPDLAGIRTVGFVSHVQTDLVAAAREAGADEVLARSAFAANLPRILEAGR